MRCRAGVTLLELIVVVTILSILFGIGLGAFRKLARPDREATAHIKQALRDGHLFARRAGTPAHIVVRPSSGEVFATGMRIVGNWHFEDEGGTGYPVPARYAPAALVPEGIIGSGLELTGSDASMRIGDLPGSFSGTSGFGVDVYVAPEPGGRPMEKGRVR